jgi:hypothetical protein
MSYTKTIIHKTATRLARKTSLVFTGIAVSCVATLFAYIFIQFLYPFSLRFIALFLLLALLSNILSKVVIAYTEV